MNRYASRQAFRRMARQFIVHYIFQTSKTCIMCAARQSCFADRHKACATLDVALISLCKSAADRYREMRHDGCRADY
jgi:hypothetical protein